MATNTAPEGSLAQKLMEQHAQNPLKVTVEDVPDEEGSSAPSSTDAAASSSWGQTTSTKAAGKQKAQEAATATATLDTESQEAFPALGTGPKSTATKNNITPIWGGANGKTNGSSWSANGTPRTSTPNSGVSTPTGFPPSLNLPGRNVESYILEPSHIMPRNQLKRPIPDIVKDINRKSRAVINMVQGPNGSLKFNATGPQDKAQQALRDLIQQVGAKVSKPPHIFCHYLSFVFLSADHDPSSSQHISL